MAKRLVRAKAKIRAAGIPFRVPAAAPAPRPPRRGAGGRLPDLQRGLRRPRRARRRGDPPRAGARRADARRGRGARAAGADAAQRRPPRGALRRRRRRRCCATRTARSGTATRSRPGATSSTGRCALGGRGPYVIQAAIAALHADDAPDWPQLAALYGELARLTGSPVVELNRAVAIAEAGERRGRARHHRRPGPRRLPLPARGAGRAAAPARPRRGGARGLRAGARARARRRRAGAPRAAPRRA